MCVSLIGGLIFSSNPPDAAIFNWVSKIIWDSVFFLYFALWLVQKTRASLLTDQMPTKSNHNLVPRVFPLRSQFGRFFFELLLSLKGFFFLLMVVTITLVLVLQHFFYEKFSILQTDTYLLVTQILVMRK